MIIHSNGISKKWIMKYLYSREIYSKNRIDFNIKSFENIQIINAFKMSNDNSKNIQNY